MNCAPDDNGLPQTILECSVLPDPALNLEKVRKQLREINPHSKQSIEVSSSPSTSIIIEMRVIQGLDLLVYVEGPKQDMLNKLDRFVLVGEGQSNVLDPSMYFGVTQISSISLRHELLE